jgi:hypothetical protein
MRTLLADTYYFLALLDSSEKHDSEAVEAARNAELQLVTTEWVLMEFGDAYCHPDDRIDCSNNPAFRLRHTLSGFHTNPSGLRSVSSTFRCRRDTGQMRKVWDNEAMSIFGSRFCRHALGRVSDRSGKAVVRVRQRQNKLRAPHLRQGYGGQARFAGCLTLPGQKERELCVSRSGRLDDIPQTPVKVDFSAKDGKDQRDARDESRQNQTKSNQIKPSAFAMATARQGGLSPPYAEAGRKRRSSCGCATFAPYGGYSFALRESRRIKPNQACRGTRMNYEL